MKRICAPALLIAGLLATGVAQSQPGAGASASSESQARTLYAEGDAAYRVGRYEDAIAKFTRAYELSPRPELQFNLANAYERLGKLEEAVAALELYRPAAAPEEQSEIDARVKALRKRIAENKKAAKNPGKPKPTPTPQSAPATTGTSDSQTTAPPSTGPTDDGPRDSTSSPTVGYVLLGLGGASLIAGTVLGILARSAHSSASDKCSDELCLAEAEDDIDREKSLALGADIGFGAGLLLGGIGFALVLSHDDGSETVSRPAPRAALFVAPQPGGGQFGFRGRF